jgi:hypothetical protein
MRTIHCIFLGLVCLALAACAAGGGQAVRITGPVARDLSGGEFVYEGTPGGKQVFVQKTGSGGDIMVLTISLPADDAPGEYAVASTGAVSAGYYESVGGVSQIFDRDVEGTLTITESGEAFTGSLAMSATSAAGGDPITIIATFNSIPFEGTAAGAAGSGGLFGSTVGLLMLVFLAALLVASFGFQFWVGSQVYERGAAVRSLRGTRTFIRGWRDPDLRMAMIGWSVTLVALLLIIFFIALLSLILR